MTLTKTVAVVLKTNEGGQWALPQIGQLEEQGHKVTLIIPAGGGRLESDALRKGVRVITTEFDFSFSSPVTALRGLLELRSIIRRLKPDVVFYHLYASAIASRLSTIRLGVKRVHMIAGPIFLESSLIRIVEGLFSSLDDCVIAGSEYTYREYLRLPGFGPKRLTMVPYGTDTESRRPLDSDLKPRLAESLGFDLSRFTVVFVAYVYAPKRFVGQEIGLKGHEKAIAAWREFIKMNPNSQLLMIGGGFGEAGEKYRRRLIESTGDCPSIVWLNSVESVADYYHIADVSISPSLSENHGAAMEAGAYGVPSIVSDAGGLPEMVPEGGGWVVRAGDADAILSALQMAHRAWREGALPEMGSRSRRHIEDGYSWHRTLPEVADKVLSVTQVVPPTIYSEARFVRDRFGRTFATDGANTDAQWKRYRLSSERTRILARTDLSSDALSVTDEIICGEVVPLPHYTGIGIASALPRVVTAAFRQVSSGGLPILRLPGAVSSIGASISILFRKPYAVELVGDIEGVSESGVLPRWMPKRLLGGMTRFFVRRSAAVRYVTFQTLQEKYPAGSNRVHSISNVVLDDLYAGSSPRRMPRASVRLLCVGSMANAYKGHEYAIDAVAELRLAGVDAVLKLVGDGAHRSALESRVAELEGEDFIKFAGSLDRAAVAAEYDRSDVLLQPSLTEGMPRTVIEAMAKGLPVVATRVGGSVELVEDRYLVPPRSSVAIADCVMRLLNSETDYRAVSKRNLDFSRRFMARNVDEEFGRWTETLKAVIGANED